MIIKVGHKNRHVILPENWRIVNVHEKVQLGDRYLRCPKYDGWVDVDNEDVAEMKVIEFDCLIRRI